MTYYTEPGKRYTVKSRIAGNFMVWDEGDNYLVGDFHDTREGAEKVAAEYNTIDTDWRGAILCCADCRCEVTVAMSRGIGGVNRVCNDCSDRRHDHEDEARTYHVEFSPATGTYRVIEYRADGDRWIVVADALTLTEARRRCAAFAR